MTIENKIKAMCALPDEVLEQAWDRFFNIDWNGNKVKEIKILLTNKNQVRYYSFGTAIVLYQFLESKLEEQNK